MNLNMYKIGTDLPQYYMKGVLRNIEDCPDNMYYMMYTDHDPSSIPLSSDDGGKLHLVIFFHEDDANFYASFDGDYDKIKYDDFIKKTNTNMQVLVLIRKDILYANNITDVHDLVEYYLDIDTIEINQVSSKMFYIEDEYSSSLISFFNGDNNKLTWSVFNSKEDAQYAIDIIKRIRGINTSNYKICSLESEPIDFNDTPILVSKK